MRYFSLLACCFLFISGCSHLPTYQARIPSQTDQKTENSNINPSEASKEELIKSEEIPDETLLNQLDDWILYKPLGYKAIGIASWYGKKFQGRRTASGERFNMHAMTAAHRSLPMMSYVKVINLSNQKSVIVKINDRGPFARGRLIDVSYGAAVKLDLIGMGTAKVRIEAVSQKTNQSK